MRDVAGVEHRPLLRQVLARRQARRVVARLRAPCPRPSSGRAASVCHTKSRGCSCERARVRRASRGRTRPTTCSGWSRTTSRRSRVGEACPALLLTAKARVIAPLVVWRRGDDDFLAPDRAGARRASCARSWRGCGFRAQCEIEPEEHESRARLRRRGRLRDRLARRARGARLRARADARRRRSSSCAGSRRACRAGATRSTTDPPGRGGPRRDAHLLLEGLLSRARSRSRGSTTAATRTASCASSSWSD